MRYRDLYVGQCVYHTRRKFWGTVVEFDDYDATIEVDEEYRAHMGQPTYYADIGFLVAAAPMKPIYLVSPIFMEAN